MILTTNTNNVTRARIAHAKINMKIIGKEIININLVIEKHVRIIILLSSS